MLRGSCGMSLIKAYYLVQYVDGVGKWDSGVPRMRDISKPTQVKSRIGPREGGRSKVLRILGPMRTDAVLSRRTPRKSPRSAVDSRLSAPTVQCAHGPTTLGVLGSQR